MNARILLPLLLIPVLGWAPRFVLGAPIDLEAPRDFQVFQRQSPEETAIALRGRVEEPATSLEYRLVGKPRSGELAADWHGLSFDPQTRIFDRKIKVPDGGWYRLEVRAFENARLVHESIVEHVGIGEVFIVAGQSNSANYGSEKQAPKSGMVSAMEESGAWRAASDPQPVAGGSGGSFLPAFGDAMAARFGVPIGLVSVGAGGTSVREWLPKGARMKNEPTVDGRVTLVEPGVWESRGDLFERLLKPIKILGLPFARPKSGWYYGPIRAPRQIEGAEGFRAVLWHQGESDAGQAREGRPADRQISGEQYREFLGKLIRSARREAGWEVPWFVAQATYHNEADPADAEFRAAQKSLWGSLALEGPDSDSLGAPWRDGVHFNARGLQAHGGLWAKKVGDWLEKGLAPKPVVSLTKDSFFWNGFFRVEFVFEGRKALLISPNAAAPGNPWIWRTEFFGHEPQADIALLGRGFHLVYLDLQNLYGAPIALDAMDAFYGHLMEHYELSKKPVLEGFSRGGLFAYNWAARNPGQVGAIYGDAPVCDFKSWPGGKFASKGSPGDWERLKGVYGFRSEEEALAYPLNPVDNLAPLARAKIPILHVAGDADKTVPIQENTLLIQSRYEALGGTFELIRKPGVDHHPHSLVDPAPIVRFILRHTPGFEAEAK